MTLCQPDNKHTSLCNNVSCCSPSSSVILVRTGFRSTKVKEATPSESSMYLVRLSSNSFVLKFLWFLMWYNTAAVFFWVIDVTLEYQISTSILLFVSVSSAGSDNFADWSWWYFIFQIYDIFQFFILITFFHESCVLVSESFSRLFKFLISVLLHETCTVWNLLDYTSQLSLPQIWQHVIDISSGDSCQNFCTF